MAAQLASQFCFCTRVHSRTGYGFPRVVEFGAVGPKQARLIPFCTLQRLPFRLCLRCLFPLSATIAVLVSDPAQAATVKMGADNGTLIFVPASLSVPAGEKITFVNNKGFPHNVIFEKDGVPEGVQAETISHRDYMNEQGEQFVVTLKEKGLYRFFCEPHRDAKMFGEITVT
eukprot:c20759_g1_i1 orf=159-674(+)